MLEHIRAHLREIPTDSAARHRRLRFLFVAAPLLTVAVTSIAIRAADPSFERELNQQWILEKLQHRLETAVRNVRSEVDEGAYEREPFRQVRRVVRSGDSFAAILDELGISPQERRKWVLEAGGHDELTPLHPGRVFTFLIDPDRDELAGLHYETSAASSLVMRAVPEGITSDIERLPRMVDVMVVAGAIETSLYSAVVNAGAPDEVISRVVDIFGWEVDFNRDLQRGDRFRIAYQEPRTAGGKVAGERQIVAAELELSGKVWTAVAFEDGSDGAFYTPDGEPLSRGFLRYPVEFTRISSRFSRSRFHPILKVERPHLGVDFAAPRGTPVRSIASGRVTEAGRRGGNGKFVKVSHRSGIGSSYSHLNSIRVRRGQKVDQGQVIGTVGETGLATGPHLHFEMYRNGEYVNPMKIKLPAAESLPESKRSAFEAVRDERLAFLETVSRDRDDPKTVLTRVEAPME